jgi:hypothetical protein
MEQEDMQVAGAIAEVCPIQLALSNRDVASLIANRMIGWSIFVLPSFVAILAGNKFVALVIWLIGGMFTLCW